MKHHITLIIFALLTSFSAVARAQSWKPQVVGVAPSAYDLQFSPDGRWLLATMGAGEGEDSSPMKAFDLTKRIKAREFDATFAEFSPDSKTLVIFDRLSSELKIVDLQNGKIQQRWKALTPQIAEGIDDVRFQKNGRELVVVTPFRIWRLDVQSGKKLSQTKIQIQAQESPHGFNGGFLLKDERRLLYINGDEGYIYDVRTGKRRSKAEFGLLSHNEKWQWFYNAEVGQFWISDFATSKNLWGAEFNDEPQFSGDGRSLIVVDPKSGVRLLDPRTGKTRQHLKVPVPQPDIRGTNATYALSPDNNYWFARQGDKILRTRLR